MMTNTCVLWMDFLPPATITNSITDLLHGILLLVFTILSIKKYREGLFKINIVILFLFFCVGISLGAYLHTLPPNEFTLSWRIAGLITIAQFLLVVGTYANLKKPTTTLLQTDKITQLAVIVCLFFEIKYQIIPIADFNRDLAWQNLAFILLIQGIILIIRTHGEVRTAFIVLMIANLMWPLLQNLSFAFGCTDERNAYYIDIYHILLAAFSYKMYLACAHGGWVYPKSK